MPEIIEIDALTKTPWDIWLHCSETQLLHYFEPEPGIFLAESPNVIERALAAGYEPVSFLIDKKQLDTQVENILQGCGGIPVYLAETETICHISGYHLTRGVLCAMRRREQRLPDGLLTAGHRIAVLENVMNPTNLGAIFRSAAALHIEAVLLTAGCADPLYRRAVRVSMGTVFQVPWTVCTAAPTAEPVISRLKQSGWMTAATALTDSAIPIDTPELHEADRLAVVLGTEGTGLHPETIAACDHTVIIPMAEGIDSLNVAAASAVTFWELRRR